MGTEGAKAMSAPVCWPYQSTPYLSALPGVAGPGMNVSAGDLPSKVYLITSFSDEEQGGPDPRAPNTFSGTSRWCWEADQGAGFHKWVFPNVGGYVKLGRTVLTSAGRGNMDYIGHAAPGAGLFYRCANMNLNGGSNMRVWNMPVWVGDEPAADGVTNFHAGNRDALQASGDGFNPSTVAHINCEARFTMDEGVQVFYAMNGYSWIRGAIYDPLHTPPDFGDPDIPNHEPGADHGYGQLIGGSDYVDNTLVSQSLFAHTTDRNPLASSNKHCHLNNLHYDHGRPHIAKGEGLNVSDNGGFNAEKGVPMQCNMVGCVSVRGPNNNDAMAFAKVTGKIPEGSTGHAAYNSQFGWENPLSQDDFFTSKPEGYMQPTLRHSAWPAGLGANYSGIHRPCAEPLNPQVREGLAFAHLMRRTVGCMPGRRHLYSGGLNTVINQIEAAIWGVHATSQWANTVEEAGGWPAVPMVAVDPTNPGREYHAPLPLGPDRDEILLSGHFSDGSSCVGYSKIRAWCIEEYFRKMRQ